MSKTHGMYRHFERRRKKEITIRDMQAIYNFVCMGISLETLAEQFGCSVARIAEIATLRPWLRSKSIASSVNLTWWESDHSDPLELVKLFYPQYLPKQIPSDVSVKKHRQTLAIDPAAYLEKTFGEEYITPANIKVVESTLDQIIAYLAEQHEPEGTPKYSDLVKGMLDQMIISAS